MWTSPGCRTTRRVPRNKVIAQRKRRTNCRRRSVAGAQPWFASIIRYQKDNKPIANMRFCRHVPGLPLGLFVEFFWYYDSWYPDHAMENCLPDGSFELIINLQEQPRKLFDRENSSRHRAFRRAWLSGTHSGY